MPRQSSARCSRVPINAAFFRLLAIERRSTGRSGRRLQPHAEREAAFLQAIANDVYLAAAIEPGRDRAAKPRLQYGTSWAPVGNDRDAGASSVFGIPYLRKYSAKLTAFSSTFASVSTGAPSA